MNIELTPAERLILINQFRILAAIIPAEAEYFARRREVIEGGFSYEYVDELDRLVPGLTKAECIEVRDILFVFKALRESYEHLDDKDGIDPRDIKFSGFSGNTESSQLRYVHFLVNRLTEFNEFRNAGDRLDSHFPALDGYRRMVALWHELDRPFHLTKELIRDFIVARTHPDSR